MALEPASISGVPAYRIPLLFIMIFVAMPLIIYLLEIKLFDESPFCFLSSGLVFQSTTSMFNSEQLLRNATTC